MQRRNRGSPPLSLFTAHCRGSPYLSASSNTISTSGRRKPGSLSSYKVGRNGSRRHNSVTHFPSYNPIPTQCPDSCVLSSYRTLFPWFHFNSHPAPHFKRASAESSAWIDSFNVFRDRKRADFIQSCTELLVSYGYPSASYEEFRTCCDFMNIVFLLDEICDDQDEGDSRSTGETFLRALRGDDSVETSTLGRITREYVLTLWISFT